ncbi:DUF429 domain-containing protein [Pseudalkalibacillus caeni]|uniref:DUF429 domain-containing protein n=1 Tax=Exobacillus caeni TaxID=2574798 RepID=A0A5R9F2R0_9BACL|nr:DUF429 domain-containing protein [Pseudalkalibacillus caeni]TLS36596.1 DUF429 domain-containing protein [Pseudalkalibacillus caeni]
MKVIGIDLAGPSNKADTSLSIFEEKGNKLFFKKNVSGIGDREIYQIVEEEAETSPLVIGIDAPLSYNDGGGDRPGDRSLRREIIEKGMKSGSIMTPTTTRMVYLTLRGIAISRGIGLLDAKNNVSIVEVHPGAAIGLRNEDIETVLRYKKEPERMKKLKQWFEEQKVTGIPGDMFRSTHKIDSCAAAFAAWKWFHKESIWCEKAEPPQHPFDYSC